MVEIEREEEYLLPHWLVFFKSKAKKSSMDESVLGVDPPNTPDVHREPSSEEGLGIHEHIHQGSIVLPRPIGSVDYMVISSSVGEQRP